MSGQALPGSPEWSGAIGVDYRRPAFSDRELHLSSNIAYYGESNTDNALSEYGGTPSATIVDISVGLERPTGFDVSLIVKNALDEDTPTAQSWNSFTVREPRWYGLVVSGRFLEHRDLNQGEHR